MSDEFIIERTNGGISREEWTRLVESVSSLKLVDGDAAICFDGEWIPVFSFRRHDIAFKEGDFPERVFPVALKLAKALKAKIGLEGSDDVFRTIGDFWKSMGIPREYWPETPE